MSVDERLEQLAGSVEAHRVDTTTALMEVQAMADKQKARRRVQWAVAASVAVIAGAVFGPGVLDSLTSQDDIQPIEQPSDPVEPPIHADGDWVRVEGTGLDASTALFAVTEVDGRLIGVGSDWPGGGGILTSTDGVTWTRPDTGSWYPGGGVVRGGPGVIAYGEGRVVGTSPDGLTWTPTQLPFEAPYVNVEIHGIAVGEWGLVAVGSRDPGRREDAGICPSDYAQADEGGAFYSIWPDAAVWTSTDGLTWDSVTDASLGGPWGQQINDVATIGTRLVAVGSVEAGPLDSGESQDPPPSGVDPAQVGRRAAVWTSVDGTSWSRVPHDPAVFGAAPCVAMHKVVAGGPGLVAIGIEYPEGATSDFWDEGRRTVVWTSVDGQTWTRVPDEQLHGLDFDVQYTPSRVVNIGGELIALGRDFDGAGAPWTSVDGLTWQRLTRFGGPDGHHIFDVIQTDTGLLAVGAVDWGGQAPASEATPAVVWVLERP